MMTLREFIELVNGREHYRIYQPNRDCLIFESYFKVHSPYYFDHSKEHALKFKEDYWNNNSYCNDVYYSNKPLDEETQELLKYYGDYTVFRIECGSFRPTDVRKTRKGKLQIHYVKDERRPYNDYLECFDIFIIG